ncbi:histidine phosphatase family protein [Streptomyces globisporus]|uniref:histidine phosphatase family protein n=1 Tax=Streptomyces globisporus TaxID=1908 RepID=UPI0036F7A4B0
MTTRLLLVRHGETEWHAENRYAGVTDVGLTPRGVAQATDLGDWAVRAGVDAVACSPLSRARLTASPAAEALGLAVKVQEGLREVDFGWGEGRTIQEMGDEDPEAVRRFCEDADSGAFPGSEPVARAAERATASLRGLADRHQGNRVLVVAHNTLLRIALCELLGLPLGRYRRIFPRLDNGAVTEIEIRGTETALRSLNVPTAPTPAPAPGPDPAGD